MQASKQAVNKQINQVLLPPSLTHSLTPYPFFLHSKHNPSTSHRKPAIPSHHIKSHHIPSIAPKAANIRTERTRDGTKNRIEQSRTNRHGNVKMRGGWRWENCMCVLFPPRFGGGKSKVEKGVFLFYFNFFFEFF